LLVVLVVIVMLSLGAYTFSELMIVEAETATLYGRAAQTRNFADSGIDYVVALLENESATYPVETYNDASLYQDVLVQGGDVPRSTGRFSILAPLEIDQQRQRVRFGLVDESGKINVNAMTRFGDAAKTMLMELPEMTEEIADAILDWTDKDDDPRDYGAEEEYYLSLPSPYSPKNGPLESLDELLLVRDITPWLLFGEDANRNGLLDPGEDDGSDSMPPDNADGILDLGLSAYLTINSRESNLRSDGTEKINLGSNKLEELYDELETEFDEDTAKFVVAYRLFGPEQQNSRRGSRGSQGNNSQGGQNAGGQSSDGNSSPNSNTNSGSSASPQKNTPQSSANSAGNGGSGGGGKVTRGGMELSGGSKFAVKSIFDLVGVTVNAKINNRQEKLTSPWSDDTSEMQEYLPEIDDALTAVSEGDLSGRININQASREVLRGLPEMTDELVQGIVSSRATSLDGESLSDQAIGRETIGWLVFEQLTDLETLRKLAPYLTTRGDVYRIQVLGYFDAGPPLTRLEAVIDNSTAPPKVISVRDLTPLGIGYPRSLFSTNFGQ